MGNKEAKAKADAVSEFQAGATNARDAREGDSPAAAASHPSKDRSHDSEGKHRESKALPGQDSYGGSGNTLATDDGAGTVASERSSRSRRHHDKHESSSRKHRSRDGESRRSRKRRTPKSKETALDEMLDQVDAAFKHGDEAEEKVEKRQREAARAELRQRMSRPSTPEAPAQELVADGEELRTSPDGPAAGAPGVPQSSPPVPEVYEDPLKQFDADKFKQYNSPARPVPTGGAAETGVESGFGFAGLSTPSKPPRGSYGSTSSGRRPAVEEAKKESKADSGFGSGTVAGRTTATAAVSGTLGGGTAAAAAAKPAAGSVMTDVDESFMEAILDDVDL